MNEEKLKIVVITGSPREDGTSALLAESFIEGAEGAGHFVYRFDAAFRNVSPCRACEYCLSHDEGCIQKDDMAELRERLLNCDMVVLATPLYFSGFSAQLKTVIDRFFAFDSELRESPKLSVLLACCADDVPEAMEPLLAHYGALCEYLNWENAGRVLALGVSTRLDAEEGDWAEQAQALGAGL